MSKSALAVIPIVFGPHMFTVKSFNIIEEFKVSTSRVCAEHGGAQSIDYLNLCGECGHLIKESVLGTPAPSPTKTQHCTNQECGKKIVGKVNTLYFCPACKQVKADDKIEDAYHYGGGLVRISKEERAALLALKLNRGIHVVRVLNHQQMPSLRYVRKTYELRPGDEPYDAISFNLMRDAARKQGFSFAAYAVMKDEQAHLTFTHEYGALVLFEEDGSVLLVQLYADHEVHTTPAEGIALPDNLRLDTARLQQALVDPISVIPWHEITGTPGGRALPRLLEAKQSGAAYTVPAAKAIKHDVETQAAKLRDGVARYLNEREQQPVTAAAAEGANT